MDFRKFLEMVNEEDAYDKDVKSSDKPHDKEAASDRAKKAAVAARNKAKSLKDWFEQIDKNIVNEADLPLPILGKDGKQVSTQPGFLKMQGNDPTSKAMGDLLKDLVAQKKLQVVAPIEQPKPGMAPNQQQQQQQKPGTATTTPTTTTAPMQEEEVMEKAPPGMEDVVLSLKKKFPGEEGRAYAIAWSMYNKKHGKNESAMLDETEVEESGLQAYLGNKKYGKEGMDALRKAGRDGASKEKMAQIRAKHDKLDEEEIDEASDDYSAKKARAGKDIGKPGKNFEKIAKSSGGGEKGKRIAGAVLAKLRKTNEADIPKSGPDYGAGLGAGRSQTTFENKKTKKVNEAMNTLEAAYHEGKSHGLSKHSYACRYNEGSDEHKRYHDGFKEGLDECYGLMPNRGLVVSEIESGQDVVDNMASYGAEEGSLGEMDKTAYMQHKAKTTPGDKFKAFGQSFSDKEVLEMDDFAFESLDKQLNDLLNEGLSVNMSQGLDGPGGAQEDTVSVTAQGDDAGKLLQFIKQVGLGGLGNDQQLDGPSEPVIAVSDYGAPKFSGHDNGGPSMADLIQKMAGEDYKDEEGHDHGDMPEVKMCGTHGVDEAKCGCGEGKEMVDEVESEDQMEYQVAEDDGEGNIEADEQGAQIDAALAVGSENEKSVTEAGDGGEEASPEASGAVAAADAAEEEEAAMSESRSSFLNLYKKLALLSEESTAEKDDKAEKAAKKVAKDIEYDEGHKGKDDDKAEKAGKEVKKDIEYDDKKDKKDKKEKVDEWANDAGKDGTQQTFERDIEFMTKVISGGLNKPKSTGQQTIPVLAGDKERTGDEDMSEFRRLAGLGQ